jgi:phosphomannomutase
MMRLFEIMHKTGKSLDELIKIFPKKFSSPEIRIECPEEKKKMILEQLKKKCADWKNAEVIAIDGVRVTMPYGWGNVRASNTQPMIAMRFESDSPEGLKKIKEDFIVLLAPSINRALLEKEIMR